MILSITGPLLDAHPTKLEEETRVGRVETGILKETVSPLGLEREVDSPMVMKRCPSWL